MAQRYKSLETVSSWYFWGGVLTIIAGLAATAYLLYSGFTADNGTSAGTQFAMALGVFIATVIAGTTQIATGEAIDLAIDVAEDLSESCELQRQMVQLLREGA